MRTVFWTVTGLVLATAAAPAAAQQPFDPVDEAKNFSKTTERAAIHSTPEYKALLARVSAANATEAARIAAADPERSDGVLELRRGLRGRRAALRLGAEGLRAGPARRVRRPRRRDALRPRVVHARVPGEAPRDRDHQRLGAGAGDALPVRRADAGQGGPRRAHVRPAESGPLGPAGRGPRPGRGVPGPERRLDLGDGVGTRGAAVLRRRAGRAGRCTAESPVRCGSPGSRGARAPSPGKAVRRSATGGCPPAPSTPHASAGRAVRSARHAGASRRPPLRRARDVPRARGLRLDPRRDARAACSEAAAASRSTSASASASTRPRASPSPFGAASGPCAAAPCAPAGRAPRSASDCRQAAGRAAPTA